jgi:hypothetical protein
MRLYAQFAQDLRNQHPPDARFRAGVSPAEVIAAIEKASASGQVQSPAATLDLSSAPPIAEGQECHMIVPFEAADRIRVKKAQYCRFIDTNNGSASGGSPLPDATFTSFGVDNKILHQSPRPKS